jgi:HK97 family phage prohead protease
MKHRTLLETKSAEVATDYAFTEVKFAATGAEGVFSGYGAMFDNIDSHGDRIVRGAFADSLAERKSQGRNVPMHLMHRVFGGDGLPVGVWTAVEEDDKGLRVEGKISGMNTDQGRRIFELVKDGALGGLSIGYKVKPNGASYGNKAGEAKRTLKKLDLKEISLVDEPSNALTRVNEIKAALAEASGSTTFTADASAAAEYLKEAILAQDAVMAGRGCDYYGSGYSSSKAQALLMDSLRSAYEKLTGSRTPPGLTGWKSVPTEREMERILRDGGASHSQARALVEQGYKAAFRPREEGDDQTNGVKSAVDDLAAYFASATTTPSPD